MLTVKKLSLIILFISISTILHAQSTEHEILTGQIAMYTSSYEIFIENQSEKLTILQFKNIYKKKEFVSVFNNFVKNHEDVRYLQSWLQHIDDESIYIAAIVINDNVFALYYGHKPKRLIIRDLGIKVEKI